jgi:DNA replication licensing factor MCM7
VLRSPSSCRARPNKRPAAFEDFLNNFKTSSSEAESALQNLNIDDEDDEYDFMDESGDDAANQRRRQRGQGRSKAKYVELLKDVANRVQDNILIELDDLQAWERSSTDESLKLVESIEKNAYHYIEVFSRAVDKNLPESSQDTS